eukprot:197389_1
MSIVIAHNLPDRHRNLANDEKFEPDEKDPSSLYPEYPTFRDCLFRPAKSEVHLYLWHLLNAAMAVLRSEATGPGVGRGAFWISWDDGINAHTTGALLRRVNFGARSLRARSRYTDG